MVGSKDVVELVVGLDQYFYNLGWSGENLMMLREFEKAIIYAAGDCTTMAYYIGGDPVVTCLNCRRAYDEVVKMAPQIPVAEKLCKVLAAMKNYYESKGLPPQQMNMLNKYLNAIAYAAYKCVPWAMTNGRDVNEFCKICKQDYEELINR